MTGEQLSILASKFSDALIGLGAEMELAAADLATVAAVAAVNVNVRVHGSLGVEHVRTTADVAERQILEGERVT